MGQHRFAQAVSLEEATVVKAGAIAKVDTWTPWVQPRATAVLELHPLAVWDTLTLTITSGQGIFGRAVSLHYGWDHEGGNPPTTYAAFVQLFGYTMHTIGGSADPGAFRVVIPAPFNETRSDVLKASYFPIGGRIVLRYFFTEASFGSTQVSGDRFVFVGSGEYTTYGQM
jgi:hypothetical protein